MPWVRIDEEFPHHPKVMKAGPLGMAMQVAALCYCNRYLTDGFVPKGAAATLLDFSGLGMRMWKGEVAGGGVDTTWELVVEDLEAAGMWIPADGGWRIHGYHDYQPTREHVLNLRETRREVGRKGGQAKGKQIAKQPPSKDSSKRSSKTEAGPKQERRSEAEITHPRVETPASGVPVVPFRPVVEANCLATSEANGEAKTNPGPVPVPPVSTTGRTIAIQEGTTTGVEQARPIDNVVLVFQTWQASTGKQRAKLDGNRRYAIQAALDRYDVEDVLDAVQGWVNDPWPERAQQNDIVQLLWMGTRRKPQNVLEKMCDLWRDGPPLQVGKQTTKAIQISQQMHAMREEVMGGGLGSVERDRGRTQRQLPASRD